MKNEKKKKVNNRFRYIRLTCNLMFLGVQPKTIMDLYRERNAKKRLEHLELQQNIAKSRNSIKSTPVEEP